MYIYESYVQYMLLYIQFILRVPNGGFKKLQCNILVSVLYFVRLMPLLLQYFNETKTA